MILLFVCVLVVIVTQLYGFDHSSRKNVSSATFGRSWSSSRLKNRQVLEKIVVIINISALCRHCGDGYGCCSDRQTDRPTDWWNNVIKCTTNTTLSVFLSVSRCKFVCVAAVDHLRGEEELLWATAWVLSAGCSSVCKFVSVCDRGLNSGLVNCKIHHLVCLANFLLFSRSLALWEKSMAVPNPAGTLPHTHTQT